MIIVIKLALIIMIVFSYRITFRLSTWPYVASQVLENEMKYIKKHIKNKNIWHWKEKEDTEQYNLLNIAWSFFFDSHGILQEKTWHADKVKKNTFNKKEKKAKIAYGLNFLYKPIALNLT